MSGTPLRPIAPDADTGSDLADLLNAWTPYLASTRIVAGSVRPPEVLEGGLWYRGEPTDKALMITVRDDISGTGDPKLSDKVLFNFETPAAGGERVFEGIEIFVALISEAPATPAQGDLWAIPGGVSEGAASAETNWMLRLYDSSSWHDLISRYSANILVSDTLGVTPTPGVFDLYYGTLWMDVVKDAASPSDNNGLMVWNGSSYVAAWPVVAGETMLKTTASNSDPAASGWEIGKLHVNNSTGGIFMSTVDTWIEITDKIEFVTLLQDAIDNIGVDDFYEAMNPYYSWNLIDYYRTQNVVQQFSVSRWADLVETIGFGANIGKIDPSLTITTGLGYQSTYTVVVQGVDEYPPLAVKGNYYIYLNDPSYTFDTGDLIGQTIYKGQGVIFNALGHWEIINVILNTDLFVHRDGSLPVYAALPFTTALGASEMNLDYKSILFAAGITFSMTSVNATGENGLHVVESGAVGIGIDLPLAQLDVKGIAVNAPSRTGNVLKVAAEFSDYQWLGLRFDSVANTWNFDSETASTPYTIMSFKRDNGNVGIGIDNPVNKLEVDGSTSINGNMVATGDATVGLDLTVDGEATVGLDLTVDGDATVAGALGVGTLTPQEKLDVYGNVRIFYGYLTARFTQNEYGLKLQPDLAVAPSGFFAVAGNLALQMLNQTGTPNIQLSTSDSNFLLNNTTIGTATPSLIYKLLVEGSAYVNGLFSHEGIGISYEVGGGDSLPNSTDFPEYGLSLSYTDDITGSPNTHDSVLTMKGFAHSFGVWQLFSNSSSSASVDTEPLMFRSGLNGTWGALRTVITDDGAGKASTGTLNLSSVPTSASGLSSGDIWSNNNVITIVP
ncbi:MAG: hypothetical protein JRJ45_00495 [Deltaproteobacteria bacterium]|nr:hypothetical protein [Deltaproteobacteria bacterium]